MSRSYFYFYKHLLLLLYLFIHLTAFFADSFTDLSLLIYLFIHVLSLLNTTESHTKTTALATVANKAHPVLSPFFHHHYYHYNLDAPPPVHLKIAVSFCVISCRRWCPRWPLHLPPCTATSSSVSAESGSSPGPVFIPVATNSYRYRP